MDLDFYVRYGHVGFDGSEGGLKFEVVTIEEAISKLRADMQLRPETLIYVNDCQKISIIQPVSDRSEFVLFWLPKMTYSDPPIPLFVISGQIFPKDKRCVHLRLAVEETIPLVVIPPKANSKKVYDIAEDLIQHVDTLFAITSPDAPEDQMNAEFDCIEADLDSMSERLDELTSFIKEILG